jgi:hypothetical protein
LLLLFFIPVFVFVYFFVVLSIWFHILSLRYELYLKFFISACPEFQKYTFVSNLNLLPNNTNTTLQVMWTS